MRMERRSPRGPLGCCFLFFSSPRSRFARVLFAVVDSSAAWPRIPFASSRGGHRSLRVYHACRPHRGGVQRVLSGHGLTERCCPYRGVYDDSPARVLTAIVSPFAVWCADPIVLCTFVVG